MQSQGVGPDRVNELLSQASECFAQGREEEALRFNRDALRAAMGAFQRTGEGRLLHLALVAYRGIAVCALVTRRHAEGTTAIATGLANASVGLKHWPDAPPLLEERALLVQLEQKVGGCDTAYVSDDLSKWPFDD